MPYSPSHIVKMIKSLVMGKSLSAVDVSNTAPIAKPDAKPSGKPVEKPVYPEIEEDGLRFAIIGGKRNLKAGSLHASINYLLDVKVYDLGYIYAFLLHHILFMGSWTLLELLIEKWKEKADDQGEIAKAEVFRVANILKFWIDNFFLDIKNDPKNVKFITEFFNQQSQDFRSNSLFIVLADNVQQKLLKEPTEKKAILLNPPKPFKPKATHRLANPSAFNEMEGNSSFVLLDFDPLEIARQLTMIDFEYFQVIEAREFLNSNWKQKDKFKLCPNICKLAQWSASTMMWVISEILSVKDVKLRAASLDRVIAVSNELVKMKNFNSLKTILSAIFHPSIIRLRKTFNLLSKRTRDTLDGLRNLVSDKEDYQVLREKIKSLNPPLIPYPELYYFDLNSFDSCGSLVTMKNEDKWISVEKMVGVSFVIKGIQNYQKSRFHYQTVEEIRDHIIKFPRLSTKGAEEQSLKLESS